MPDGTEENITGHLELAPQYQERLAEAEARKNKHRTLGEFWKMGFGNFSPLTWKGYDMGHKEVSEIRGLEQTFIKQINDLLSAKESNGDSSSVIVMDFGGMYGFSMLRIASQMRELIESGRVVLVVTNLAFTPEEGIETAGEGYNDIERKEIEFLRANMDLIHYIQADASELKTASITIPNHGNVSLYRHIDLIHEHMALTHSLISDTDLPTLTGSLSQYGMLFLGSKGIHGRARSSPLDSSINGAFSVGMRNILKTGVKRIEPVYDANYEVYTKPLAPTDCFK